MHDDDNPKTEAGDLTELSSEVTTRFLKMSLDGPKKPIDSLLDRLRDAPEKEFFAGLLEQATGRTAAELQPILCTKDGELNDVLGFKNQSVELFRQYKDLQSHLSATAIYFSAIASALANHGKKITSQSNEELEAAILDLAATVDPPWADMFINAVEQLRSHG